MVITIKKEEDAAVDLFKSLFKSLKTYYNTLFNTGYKKYSDVDKLLVYNYLIEILTGDMRIYVDEYDYRIIQRALNCIYGSSCLISYPQYINNDNLFGHTFSDSLPTPRVTEIGDIIRVTQDANIRYKL